MKKIVLIPIVAAVILLAVLFLPIPKGEANDGGTKEWTALTYKIVKWNRIDPHIMPDGVYVKTRIYFGNDYFKSLDELWLLEEENIEYAYTFGANVTEVIGDTVFVVPFKGQNEQGAISFSVKDLGVKLAVGDNVKVTYDGIIMETYPAQIRASKCEIISNLCENNYITEECLDNDSPEEIQCRKPVIYLYPEKDTEVSVKLNLNGELTCTYPAYNNGWNVTASPDGTLTDKDGKIYNYLYWEGTANTEWDFSEGFCVKGEDTAEFLEIALNKLGLTRREANEFIVYWLPIMQENPYNIISFQTDAYADNAELEISPKPDTLMRVFMAFKASTEEVNLPAQELSSPEREGFTAVEWGGTEVK